MNWIDNIGKDLPQDNYIETLNLPQSNEEEQNLIWRKERFGKATSSTFGDLFNKSSKGYSVKNSVTAKAVLYRAAWERLITPNAINEVIETRTSFISKPTSYGNENESNGLLSYEDYTKNTVEYDPFKFYKVNDFIGGTPDAIITKDVWKKREGNGVIEIKCPYNGANHIKSLVEKEVYDVKHWWQCQGNMFVTGLLWCDYITYDDAMPDGLKLNIVSLERDEDAMEFLKKSIATVEEAILLIMAEIQSKIKK